MLGEPLRFLILIVVTFGAGFAFGLWGPYLLDLWES